MAERSNLQILLAWVDANISNEWNRTLLARLREEFNECTEFTEADEFERFLGRYGQASLKPIFLITSGQIGEALVPKIHRFRSVKAIYIYCSWRERHEAWAKEYNKARVVTEPDELISKLKQDLDLN